MSRINTIKTILIFAISLNVQLFNAQGEKGKVWVTVEDLSILPKTNSKGEVTSSSSSFQKIVRQFEITGVTLAFPASKSSALRKVYEIECNCNQVVLSAALENTVRGLSKPSEVPTYELMYDPNDYNTQVATDYALDLINAKGAWDISQGDTSIVLGISDANFDVTNPELVGKVNYLEPNMTDPNYAHGTEVATTAAGNTDNSIGKSSIGFNSHLRLYSMGYNQILQASNDGVRVINMSWAAGCSYNQYCQAIIDEIYANGTIMVAAAGNGSTCGGPTNLVYPSAYNHVISVTSIGADDKHDRFYNGVNYPHQHNSTVDISAPGYFVSVVGLNNSYPVVNGTSFASPYVTGTVGLMLAANPCLNADDVELILKQTSVNTDALNSQYIGLIGAGRLNAQAAVEMAKSFSKLNFSLLQTDFECNSQTGTVEVGALGGTEPYTVTWDNEDIGNILSGLSVGNHTITVMDSSGCSGDTIVEVTNMGTPNLNFDYTNNILIDSPTFLLNDLNGDGIIKVQGNITVASGVDYLIETKRLEFGYNDDPFAGIIINNNATLSVTKNSSLKGLSVCKSTWDGIVISDNINNSSGIVTYNQKAGKLIMDRVNIYNALVAVKTKDVDPLNVTNSLKYGTFEISNSVFSNNFNGFNITSNDNGTEKSSISSTIFLVEDSTINSPVHIQLADVDNLVILKNKFFGNDEVIDDLRGYAIKAENSTLFIAEDLSTDLLNIPSDGNQFYNLAYGIQSTNTDSELKNVQITGSYFTKVKESINIDKFAKGMIYQNEIDVPLGNSTAKSFAIKLGSNSSLIVTDNIFTTTNLSPDNVYGVIMTDSDTNKMDVYKNKFEGNFTVANLFEGNNLKTFIDCNFYTGTNNNHWYIASGKLGDQSGMDVNGQSLIYKNEFTNCQNDAPQILIDNAASGFVYQSKAVYMPSNATSTMVESIVISNAEDNQCRNYFDTTIPIPTKDEVIVGLGAAVYPNPTTDNSAVNWNEVDIDQITIFNATGELLSNAIVTGNQGTYEINNLSSGMYFVKMSFEETVFKTEKLVVSR